MNPVSQNQFILIQSAAQKIFKQCIANVENIDKTALTLQLLWTFDYNTKRFYLSESTYFSFQTFKTKVYLYYTSHGWKVEHAESFIFKIYSVSKLLSMRPKFQLILITISFLMNSSTVSKYDHPFITYLRTQVKVPVNFTKEQLQLLSEYEEKMTINLTLRNNLQMFLVHFDLKNIYDTLCEVVPQMIEMEIFVLK